MDTHRNRLTHAVTLASGRSLAPGEACSLTYNEEGQLDPHDKDLLDADSFVEIDETVDYDRDFTAEALQGIADGRGVKVKGTGQSGAVLKGDLVKALTADDKKKEG